MAERYQLPRSCVPPTTRRKDGGYPPSGGLEGGKTRCIREREDMVAFQGGHPPFKGDSPCLRPQPSRAESFPTRSKVLPRGVGAGSHTSCKPAQSRRSQTAVRGAYNRPAVTSDSPLLPRPTGEKAGSHAGGMQPRKWAHFPDSQHAQHGGRGPRVMQPAHRMLRACNCPATCATTAPPRLWNQYRDSRRPSARPSSASLARRSMRPKMGRQ
jgi:hypothetical protein